MTSGEVRAIVEAELEEDWSQPNAHGIDLRKCLVAPRKVAVRSTVPRLDGGKALDLWIVLEESPGSGAGYLIVFDEGRRMFGLANWDGDTAVFLGFHGTFLNAAPSDVRREQRTISFSRLAGSSLCVFQAACGELLSLSFNGRAHDDQKAFSPRSAYRLANHRRYFG